MGQGYSLTTLSAGAAGIDVPELSDLNYEKSLGNARFMKCIRARHKDGLVVAKVVMKPYPSLKLDDYVRTLIDERRVLNEIPNALGYHRIIETGTSGYLVRQYIHSSLYDRMSTRPFLEDIEKKWLAFQLLCAVRDCHAQNLYHGDIKTENILVTSWNWLYLADFSSSFKPTYLPEDNPADFSFFFDTSGRRTCYLAPERFLGPGEDATGKPPINWAMDIFSVGCVIAELFLETPIFSLSQLFKYRSKKEYDPEHTHLNRIADKDILDMVAHMIQIDPQDRYTAEEYLNFWRHKAFPEYFYSSLHQYMYVITDPTSGRRPITAGNENLGEADDRIDRVYDEFDKISQFLGYESVVKGSRDRYGIGSDTVLFPLQVDIPNNRHQASALNNKTADDGTLIFVTLVVSSIRSTARATARVRACELLLAFGERVTDEAKMDRILPYLVWLLNDKADIVKCAAIRTITQLLALVQAVSPINAYIFPEYLLPRLQPFVLGVNSKPSPWVRATYASCLATLATTASRFLGMMQALRADGTIPTSDPEAEDGTVSQSVYQNLFDLAREDLMGQFEAQTKALLTDSDSAVRRAFLGSVSTLCVFFGTAKASDVILSHLNTYLNDRDWMLKCAFFETIVGVATFVGAPSYEEFILPLMIQALADPEEAVVERVLRSFASIAELGLFQRFKTWELVDVVGRFMMHPNIWIREAAAQFISAATTYLMPADYHSVIIPLIRVYLKALPTDLSHLALLDALKKPLPRLVLEMASNWALKSEHSLFWKTVNQQHTFSFGAGSTLPSISARDLGPKALGRVRKNEEDENWIQRLRNAGMTPEDDFKLLAMREYIRRSAHRKSQEHADSTPSKLNGIVALKDLGIAAQTIFFSQDQDLFRQNTAQITSTDGHRTIAEALQDASSPTPEAKLKPPAIATDLPLPSPSLSVPNSGLQTPAEGPHPPRPPLATSPVNSVLSLRLSDQTVNRKPSAITLLPRTASNSTKAVAETSTTPATAFAKLESLPPQKPPLTMAKEDHRLHPSHPKHASAHTYEGHDPSVLTLLDSLYLDSFPVDYTEFGPMVTPRTTRRAPIPRSAPGSSAPWRPDGTLVAMLGEHTAAVNRIAVAPDHAFFITGSDDGSVKIWDSARLERNISHRARQTHTHAEGARVTALTFIEDTHCFASCASDGSVHVVKVDYAEPSAHTPTPHSASAARYGKLNLIRDFTLPDGQHAVWAEHYKSDASSLLLLATNKCRLLALELRTMTPVFTLQNPLPHGPLTCFAVDRRHHWVLLGTSHGVLDLWDLRFRLRLRAWAFPAHAPVHRIALTPGRAARRNKVTIAGGTGGPDVSVWDLEKGVCKELYRAHVPGHPALGARELKAQLELVDLDAKGEGGMLSRFGPAGLGSENAPLGPDRGVRALALGTHVPDDGSEARGHFILAAGPGGKVRYWDLAAPGGSGVVSGGGGEGAAGFTSSTVGEVGVVVERAGSDGRDGKDGKGGGSGRRGGVVALQQRHLLRGHLDVVTDVALLECPYGMVVSADRGGGVMVFA
ncbi:phosphoinositide 3-kinase regulatory subunit 4 [Trichodelitschia bisporula]|uniref:non-specific serine/threonine protein kinase n=1 Tax=Trichodelitschia bisporula TaxID=703511 RepID=A0A6G1HHZ6_9PEZI|nr:phosphoinositide 3-kinase regulatory subunit 4 [Trichodelitschia bisporula]